MGLHWKSLFNPLLSRMGRALLKCQSGNITFYTLILVPIVTTITIAAIDLSRFQALREKAQSEADRIALTVARALPNENLVQTMANGMAGDLDALDLDQPITSNERVQISLSGQVDSVFNSLFEIPDLFRVNETSVVEVVPRDTVLILSDSASLRPPTYTSWGNQTTWPASGYFNFANLPCGNSSFPTLNTICSTNQTEAFSRWATQTCFNPVLSPYKLAILGLVDTLLASPSNRLAVYFTPGDGPSSAGKDFDLIRSLSFPTSDQESRAQFFIDSEHQLNDESCAYFANQRISLDDNYQIPPPHSSYSRGTLSQIFADSISQINQHIFSIRVEANFRETEIGSTASTEYYTLPIREAIYYRMARLEIHQASAANIVSTLENAICELSPACIQGNSSTSAEQLNEQQVRGNRAAVTSRHILLVSDAMPPRADLLPILSQLEDINGKLIAVAYSHSGLNATQTVELLQNISAYRDDPRVEAVLANNPESLQSLISDRIAPYGLEYSLRE